MSCNEFQTFEKSQDEVLLQFRTLVSHLTGISLKQLSNREVVCTPCGGNYGQVAYWLLVINGSPPRGAIVYRPSTEVDGPCATLVECDSRSKRLGDAQCNIIREFAKTFLHKGNNGFHSLEDARIKIVNGKRAGYPGTIGFVTPS